MKDVMAAGEAEYPTAGGGAPVSNVECVKCECCGLAEECTVAYVTKIRMRYQGRWICGLCAEAVKEEMVRSPCIGMEEAVNRHLHFCKEFNKSAVTAAEDELIAAVKQVLLRCLELARGLRDNARCFASMDA